MTLAGFLLLEGVMLKILGTGGTFPINDTIINDIASRNLSTLAGWIVMLVLVGVFGRLAWRSRRASAATPAWSPRRPR